MSSHPGPSTTTPWSAPRLLLPNLAKVFADRAGRLLQLADQKPPLAGYLRLIAEVAKLQHGLIEFSAPSQPATLAGSLPLDVAAPTDPNWRRILRELIQRGRSGTSPLANALRRLDQTSDGELDRCAQQILEADFENTDPGLAPFVAAGLQVQWTTRAAQLDAGPIETAEAGATCPVCGSLPVAGLLRTGGPVQGLRYLCCSLCASEWNRVRIHCVNCGSSKGVGYLAIEGAGEALKAEACDDCKTYIKMMNREKDPQADPFADDLATLGLDVMLADAGYHRLGLNPFLIPGS